MLAIWSVISAFSKSSLNIWNFMVHVLLKLGLESFAHYFASVWDKCNCVVVWKFFGITFLWDWNENFFQSCGHCWVSQICWYIEFSTFTSSFRIWNNLLELNRTGIQWLSLALIIMMLPQAYLTSHSRVSGSRWVITPLWLSGSWRYFCTVLLFILATSS